MSKKTPFGCFEDGTPVAPYGLTAAGNVRQRPMKDVEYLPVTVDATAFGMALAADLEEKGVEVILVQPARANVPPEESNLPATDPPPDPPKLKDDEPEPEERDWKTLKEVEAEVGVSRTWISQMVAAEMIPGMEPGKQGKPQHWYLPQIEAIRRILELQDRIRKLDAPHAIAQACNVESYRLENHVAIITPKGMRLVSRTSSLDSMRGIARGPVVVLL